MTENTKDVQVEAPPVVRPSHPVKAGFVEPLAWGTALILADYDEQRIEILDYNSVRVH